MSETTQNPTAGGQSGPIAGTEPVKHVVNSEAEKIKAEAEKIKAEADAAARMAGTENYSRAMAISTNFMNPATWTQMRSMAKVFHESRALPASIDNEAKLVMVLQAGYEMGMTPIESVNSLYIVNGTINVYGKAITRRLREHGWRVEYKNETDTECTARVVRDRENYQETYSYDMAEKSGYTKSRSGEFKVGWLPGMNRKLKLRYGALSIILKSYLPDVLGPVNDIKETAEDVEIITVANDAKQPATITTGTGAPINSSLQDRLNASKIKKSEDKKPEVTNVDEVQQHPEELPTKGVDTPSDKGGEL